MRPSRPKAELRFELHLVIPSQDEASLEINGTFPRAWETRLCAESPQKDCSTIQIHRPNVVHLLCAGVKAGLDLKTGPVIPQNLEHFFCIDSVFKSATSPDSIDCNGSSA
ncbi:unnamed protein product [Caretta caretta]